MSGATEPVLPILTGLGGALVTALLAWWRDKRKTDVDESALVLGKWKELVEQHQSDIRDLKQDFANYKAASEREFAAYKDGSIAEIKSLRDRLIETERGLTDANKRIADQDREIIALKNENVGLQRAIAQNSKSTAAYLGRRAAATDGRMTGMEDEIARLDQAGHNLGGAK